MIRLSTVGSLILSTCLLATGCDRNQSDLHGYIEAKLTYLSSPFAGKVIALKVVRGQQVSAGQSLFALEAEPQSSDVNAAVNELKAAEARLADLKKGQRPSELEAIKSQIAGIQASVNYLKKEFSRRSTLYDRSLLEKEALDRTVQNLDKTKAELATLQANLKTALLGARQDLVEAARYQVKVANAQVAKVRWAMSEKTVMAPQDASVFDVYFRMGERVNANVPVLSILEPRNIKVVFFIPEPDLSAIKLNQKILISCDACSNKVPAIIRFISPKSEFTPPVIYSRTSRSKLVFRVECDLNPQDLTLVHPGQPVDIHLPSKVHG